MREWRSDALYAKSLKVAPGGVHSPVRSFQNVHVPTIFFESGHGAYLQSVEGESYIDFCQSFGPLILGHRDEDVSQSVGRAVNELWTCGANEPYSLELADYMVSHLNHVDKVRFVNSGTEAVMSALRLARAYTGRTKVLKFEGCYHGHVDSLLVQAGSGLAGETAASSAGISEGVASETVLASLDDIESVRKQMEHKGDELAAVILEPLPANFGLLKQRKEFLQEVFDLARANGALVIFDEVITGFRVNFGGMAAELNYDPDLVTYGKIMGGGFPVGCFAGKEKIMNMVAPTGPVYQAGTLSGNPVGMRAGLATLKKLKEKNVYEILEERGAFFEKGIHEIFERNGLPLQMIRYGSLFWICGQTEKEVRSVKTMPSGHKEDFAHLYSHLIEQKIFLAPQAFEVGFLSLAHDQKVLSESLERFETALKGAYGQKASL